MFICIIGQVRKGIELVDNNKGTLIVIMRYTGDVLLFVSCQISFSWNLNFAVPPAKLLHVLLGSCQGAVRRHEA
jgi:hypothetical protein